MKNELMKFANDMFGEVRTIVNDDGSFSINAEDVARSLGWIDIKDGKEYVRWRRINNYIKDLGFSQQVGKDDYIPESLFYLLAMKANNEVAIKFQLWLAQEVIPSIKQKGYYIAHQSILEQRDAYKQLNDTLNHANDALSRKVNLYEQGSPMPYKHVKTDVKLFIKNKLVERACSSISRERMYRLYTHGRRDGEYATITAFEQAMCECNFRLYCGSWADVDIK